MLQTENNGQVNILPQAQQPEEQVYDIPMILQRTGVKARATIDKFLSESGVHPIRRPGRQPKHTRGRKMYFTEASVRKLEKYMLANSRITPKVFKGSQEGQQFVTVNKPQAPKVTSAPKKTRKAIANKDQILARLDQALERVQYLTDCVTELSKSVRKEATGTDQTH